MPCPTCDHTMHAVCTGIWWCPRCGTLRKDFIEAPLDDSVPALVERRREHQRSVRSPQTPWR
jgi:ribosomal protein L37AE/L43A